MSRNKPRMSRMAPHSSFLPTMKLVKSCIRSHHGVNYNDELSDLSESFMSMWEKDETWKQTLTTPNPFKKFLHLPSFRLFPTNAPPIEPRKKPLVPKAPSGILREEGSGQRVAELGNPFFGVLRRKKELGASFLKAICRSSICCIKLQVPSAIL